jgi:hypothetical protein
LKPPSSIGCAEVAAAKRDEHAADARQQNVRGHGRHSVDGSFRDHQALNGSILTPASMLSIPA